MNRPATATAAAQPNEAAMILQLLDAEKRVIEATLPQIDNPDTIHKIWCICNRFSVKREKESRMKGGVKA